MQLTAGKKIGIFLATSVLVLLAAAYHYVRFQTVPEPELPGSLTRETLHWDGYDRHYEFYIPALVSDNPPLVFVFHGSLGNAEQSRVSFAYEFEKLAEKFGFIVVYPEGYDKHFNGCRKLGPYKANQLNIDDVGFMRALTEQFTESHGVSRDQVFAVGLSNGGQMAMRLALEAPDLVRAVASVSASLPTEANMGCEPSGLPVAFLLINGTDDPINPYEGGPAALFKSHGNRGGVRSTDASIAYWVDINQLSKAPLRTSILNSVLDDDSHVDVQHWREPGRSPVALYRIEGGGHNVPHPDMVWPRFLGNSNRDFNAPEAIWTFFESAGME